MRYLTTILLASILCLEIQAQTYSTRIFQPQVRTLRMQTVQVWDQQQTGNRLNPVRPILVLGNDGEKEIDGSNPENTLEVSFDEMSHDTHMYTYTVLHLNADWTLSDLSSSEYVQGFTTQDITDYEHSINTSQLYTHYRFTFPHENMRLTASGNYALLIYEDNNPDKIVAHACFSVVEPRIAINATVRANTDIEFNGRFQQVDIDINTSGLDIKDAGEITLLVRQNNRLDNQVYLNKPTFIEPHRLRYVNQKNLIFEGGNEYRHFDTYSTYFAGSGVHHIEHDHVDYHAILFADDILSSTGYMHEFDVNGQFLVHAERTYNSDIEAEYMWVHWQLPVNDPWFDGSLYIGGELFQNRMTADNRMQYDATHHCYWFTTLVKQGGTDYQYWFVPKGNKNATLQRTEGSHWETQNEYSIYVYYRPFGSRADKLIGFINR